LKYAVLYSSVVFAPQ